MIYDRVDIREKYYNGFWNLQYRNRKNKEKLAKYILLLNILYGIFSSSDVSKVENHCPFILKIKKYRQRESSSQGCRKWCKR